MRITVEYYQSVKGLIPFNDKKPFGGTNDAPAIEREVKEVVQEAIEKHGKRDAFIPILSEINHALGYIPAKPSRR
jgi:5-methylcytosine-specific restriction endonuclease McrBC GTP-binding regulatory subunit McrB